MGIQEHLIEADKLETYGASGECHRPADSRSAANRLIGEVVQSWRRPLLGPSPG